MYAAAGESAKREVDRHSSSRRSGRAPARDGRFSASSTLSSTSSRSAPPDRFRQHPPQPCPAAASPRPNGRGTACRTAGKNRSPVRRAHPPTGSADTAANSGGRIRWRAWSCRCRPLQPAPAPRPWVSAATGASVQLLVDAHQVVVTADEERVDGVGQIDDARRPFRRGFGELRADRGEQRLPGRLIRRQRVQRHGVPAAQRRGQDAFAAPSASTGMTASWA